MTFEQAKAKAAALTAAGVITIVEKNGSQYGTRNFERRRACWIQHNRERSATGYWSEYRQKNSERRAANNRAYRARRKAYFDQLFA